MRSATRLAAATSRRAGTPNSLRTGTVVAVAPAGITVTVGGGTVTAGMMGGAGAGVAPGAVVALFNQGDSWLITGVINGAGQGADTPVQPQPATNSVILPPVNATDAGSVVALADTMLASGLNSTSGTVFINTSIRVKLPLGHLCEVRVHSYQASTSSATTLTVFTVREGPPYPTGGVYASYEQTNPFAGLGSHFSFSGYVIGDGAEHQLGLCAAVLTPAGSNLTVNRTQRSFIGVIDWGDASGVLKA